MALGSFCLVLHGHLPYVLRHGRSPHGEDWLHEAVAETYLPLLALIDEFSFLGKRPRFGLGLTPVLLEQLAHEVFRGGFRAYLRERLERAEQDRRAFEAAGESHCSRLAERWKGWYLERQAQFESVGGDLCAAFARRASDGLLQILGSAATHAYLPLLCEDSSVRAQIRAGLASSRRRLGFSPRGFWLPECAYRPRGPWRAPIDWSGKDDRPGLERLVADEGVSHVFVEHHLLERGRSRAVRHGAAWRTVDEHEADKYPGQGWRSVHEVHGVASGDERPPRLSAFARHPGLCEQVWSGAIGYPADGAYLEFHKLRGPERGLRYWKITDKEVDLGHKHPYRPDDIPGRIHVQAQHFCGRVKEHLRDHRERTGRAGVAVAAFDAELFGHWWFEGPQFLRDVLLTLDADPEVDVLAPEEVLERAPPDKLLALPEGSWGEGGDHRVWTDPRVHWMWEIEYRCEVTFGRLTYELPWREHEPLARLLRKAARELLLLQASDWPFAITRGQALDYGIKRFILHVARFESLADLCRRLGSGSASGDELDPVERHAIEDADLHDLIFADIDLDWWNA